MSPKRHRTTKRAHPVRHFFAVLFRTLLLIFLVTLVCVLLWGYRVARNAIAERPFSEMAEKIESQENFVPYDELPSDYVDAVVAVEDSRFFYHNGVDIFSIGRAFWTNLTSGTTVEGGSTITQQLMKNQYFSGVSGVFRKVPEMFTALMVEKVFSKEEIFALYANSIYFGAGYYGIYDAAEGYYGVTPQELTFNESTMLAGIPNAPSVYSPKVNPTLARERQQKVISSMVTCGYLTQEEADERMKTK
ncbi:MAG: biosynthetic peptidoglycan transglycosylase [Lachnospiraceae bacterium]|jgi:monofunctional glycosyltransferase